MRLGLFLFLICFLVVGVSFTKNLSNLYTANAPDSPFLHLLTNFRKSELPYETGKLKAIRLSNADSAFIKSAIPSKNLIAVTDPTANVWDDADEEGKIHFDFPELIGAGSYISLENGIFLLEVVDMYELKGESESNKQGVFSRTTFLCTFTKDGKFINAVVSNFNLANEHGTISRWSCIINSANEIIIKEYGARKEMKDNYGFTSTLKIMDNGKIVKIKSVKG